MSEVDPVTQCLVEEASGDAYKMVVKGRCSDNQYQTLVRAGDELWEITVRRSVKSKEQEIQDGIRSREQGWG